MPNIYLTPNFIETQRQKGISDDVLASFIGKHVPEVAQQLQAVQDKYGKNNLPAIKSYLNYKVYGTTAPTSDQLPQQESPEGFFQTVNQNVRDARGNSPTFTERIGGRIEKAGVGVRESLEDYSQGKQGPLETTAQVAAQTISGIVSPATETLSTVAGAGLKAVGDLTGLSEALPPAIKAVARTKPVQSAVQGAAQLYQTAKEKAPAQLKTATTVGKAALDVADIATAGFASKAGKEVVEATVEGSVKAGALEAQKRALQSAKKVDNVILEGIQTVRPTAAGKRTASDLATFDEQATTAVKTIIAKKDQLQLANEFGEEVTENLPQNIRQFADAIEQTRENVFREYDTLAKEAGEAGAQVDLTRVAGEVIDAVSDPRFVSLEDQAPQVAEYLLKRASALERRRFYTAEQAQQAVKNYNATLKAFYDNPTYENYAYASIDAMLANNIRKGLDDAVEGLTGGQYAELKKQYGALKAIEADVVKRAVVDARKNAKGLLDFTDIFTGGDLIAGLATMNPALLAKAGAQKGIKEYFKFLNDPNRSIRSMFRKADALMKALPTDQ